MLGIALDQQDLVAVIEQFLSHGPTDRAGAGDADSHHLTLGTPLALFGADRIVGGSSSEAEHAVILTHAASSRAGYPARTSALGHSNGVQARMGMK
jgi:hypothetical protein